MMLQQGMKDQGAPVDVVGLQCHFAQFLRSPEECLTMLDRFAAFGYPLHITERDINTPGELVQADYMRDIMTVFFPHPAAKKIPLWGFWEGCHSGHSKARTFQFELRSTFSGRGAQ